MNLSSMGLPGTCSTRRAAVMSMLSWRCAAQRSRGAQLGACPAAARAAAKDVDHAQRHDPPSRSPDGAGIAAPGQGKPEGGRRNAASGGGRAALFLLGVDIERAGV